MMLPVSVAPTLTPHGRLTLVQDHDAAAVEAEFAQRVQSAFVRGSGHGLLQLGANEVGMALPATLSFWREFAATYVTTVCTRLGPVRERRNLHVPVPANSELDQFVLSAPPMTGAEYLTAAVLRDLWQELDRAFVAELSEAQSGLEPGSAGKQPERRLSGLDRSRGCHCIPF